MTKEINLDLIEKTIPMAKKYIKIKEKENIGYLCFIQLDDYIKIVSTTQNPTLILAKYQWENFEQYSKIKLLFYAKHNLIFSNNHLISWCHKAEKLNQNPVFDNTKYKIFAEEFLFMVYQVTKGEILVDKNNNLFILNDNYNLLNKKYVLNYFKNNPQELINYDYWLKQGNFAIESDKFYIYSGQHYYINHVYYIIYKANEYFYSTAIKPSTFKRVRFSSKNIKIIKKELDNISYIFNSYYQERS